MLFCSVWSFRLDKRFDKEDKMAKESWIPAITDERLAELVARIKPIVRMERIITEDLKFEDGAKGFRMRPDPSGKLQPWQTGELYYIEPVDPRGVAFSWDPIPTEKAMGIMPVRDITTYHSFGYYGNFKPSVAEVLAMIPQELVDEVVAFEIIKSPETADDLNRNSGARDAGYHVATTRLYKRG